MQSAREKASITDAYNFYIANRHQHPVTSYDTYCIVLLGIREGLPLLLRGSSTGRSTVSGGDRSGTLHTSHLPGRKLSHP